MSSVFSSFQDALSALYLSHSTEMPKFTFMVVTKKIDTRFFTCGPRHDNPVPGTVVDDVVTQPER